ncbi:MAG: hypothetical protein OXN21_02070 [Chloroflexota bacterium]|nr:hypothetical protein [Chloroflexota bacterium]
MTIFLIRRWLPPTCLAALIVVVWALPYSPDCDSLAWGDDPAIARVDSECILLSHYTQWLRIIEAVIDNTEQGLIMDCHAGSDYQRRFNDRVNLYGPETMALADSIRDSVLNQRAVAAGYAPSREEVSAGLEEHRLSWERLNDMIQLVKLAQNRDLAGFTKLAAETKNPHIFASLEYWTPAEFMESLEQNDWRELEQMRRDNDAYVDFFARSFGRERYWQEILPAKLSREMAISRLEEAVLEAGLDGPHAEAPRLAWLDYLQQALKGVNVEVTQAAPTGVSADRALAYLDEVLRDKQDELGGEREVTGQWENSQGTTSPPCPDSK